MRLLHWVLALAGALLLGAWLAPMLGRDPGYVLVRFQGWAFEASVTAVLAALLVLLLVLLLAWRLVAWAVRAPRRAVENSVRRRREQRLERGLLALSEGRWSDAERLIARDAKGSGDPSVHYLIAARAAQERDDRSRREDFLALADGSGAQHELAVGLTRAEMLLDDGDRETAAVILESLLETHPRNERALSMLSQCYRELGRWSALRRLLPRLKRVPGADVESLQREAIIGECRAAADPPALEAVWSSLKRGARRDSGVMQAWANRALQLGDDERVASRLPPMVRAGWSPELVRLYGRVRHPEPGRALKTAEGWLGGHPDDPDLLLTLGRLCRQADLPGKARHYLDRCLALESRGDAYRELAELMESEGDTAGAIDCYRKLASLRHERVADDETPPGQRRLAAPPDA